jgi:hypothetical protein
MANSKFERVNVKVLESSALINGLNYEIEGNERDIARYRELAQDMHDNFDGGNS